MMEKPDPKILANTIKPVSNRDKSLANIFIAGYIIEDVPVTVDSYTNANVLDGKTLNNVHMLIASAESYKEQQKGSKKTLKYVDMAKE